MPRLALLVVAVAGLASCAEVEPGVPPMMGANEMQQRPGAFSGPSGQFVVAGGQNWPVDPVAGEEVADAGP